MRGEIRRMKGKKNNLGYNHENWSLYIFSHAQGVGGANW